MAVILSTGRYFLLRRVPSPQEEDEHGVPVPSTVALASRVGPFVGAVRDTGDGSFSYRLDPSAAPVSADDIIVSEVGVVRLVVKTSRTFRNAAVSDLDYIGGVAMPDPGPRR